MVDKKKEQAIQRPKDRGSDGNWIREDRSNMTEDILKPDRPEKTPPPPSKPEDSHGGSEEN